MSIRKQQIRGIPLLGIERIKMVVLSTGKEFVYETSSELSAEPVTEEGESKILKIDGKVLANVEEDDLTLGSTVTITNHAFIPELVKELQGGVVLYDADGRFKEYQAPPVGESISGEIIDLYAYTRPVERGGYTGEILEIYIPRCLSGVIFPSISEGEYISTEYKLESRPMAGQLLYGKKMIKKEELPKINVFTQRKEYDPAPDNPPDLIIYETLNIPINDSSYNPMTSILQSATDGYGKDIKDFVYVFSSDLKIDTEGTYTVILAVKDDWNQITKKTCIVKIK